MTACAFLNLTEKGTVPNVYSENFELVLEKRAMSGQGFGVGGAKVASTVFKPVSNVRFKTSIDASLLAKYKTWEA